MAHRNCTLKKLTSRPKAPPSICLSCLLRLRQQRFVSTAEATSSIDPPFAENSSLSPHTSSLAQLAYKIKASVLLSRPPLLTRDLTPFEKAYFLYQRRLNERLALPFTRYFYYQRGTPGDVNWKRKMKERQTPARDIGNYNAYSKDMGWNDELLVGASESEPQAQIEALVRDAEEEIKAGENEEAEETAGKKQKQKVERPMPRVTEADRAGDFQSLNRALTRTLYLVVRGQGEKAGWEFPSSSLEVKESLNTAAERILVQSAGSNMNTWIVGNMPIGHRTIRYQRKILDQETGAERLGEKVFFMKGRIMAGQANLSDNKFGLVDFKWLAKDEIEKELQQSDWNSVRNILLDR